jgi:hypothetical protein
MKSTLTVKEERKPQPSFPLLAESRHNSVVVMFMAEREGVIVRGFHAEPIGYHKDSWRSCFDASVWPILPPGTLITLEQE